MFHVSWGLSWMFSKTNPCRKCELASGMAQTFWLTLTLLQIPFNHRSSRCKSPSLQCFAKINRKGHIKCWPVGLEKDTWFMPSNFHSQPYFHSTKLFLWPRNIISYQFLLILWTGSWCNYFTMGPFALSICLAKFRALFYLLPPPAELYYMDKIPNIFILVLDHIVPINHVSE